MKLPPLPPLRSSSKGCRNSDLGGGEVLGITVRLVASYSSLVFHVVAEIMDCLGPELLEVSSHGRLLEELLKRLGSGLLPLGRSLPFVARWAGRRWCKKSSCKMLAEDLQDARRKLAMFLLVSSFLYSVFLLPRCGVVIPMWGWPASKLCKGCKPDICILDYFIVMCWTERIEHMLEVVDERRFDRYWCDNPW